MPVGLRSGLLALGAVVLTCGVTVALRALFTGAGWSDAVQATSSLVLVVVTAIYARSTAEMARTQVRQTEATVHDTWRQVVSQGLVDATRLCAPALAGVGDFPLDRSVPPGELAARIGDPEPLAAAARHMHDLSLRMPIGIAQAARRYAEQAAILADGLERLRRISRETEPSLDVERGRQACYEEWKAEGGTDAILLWETIHSGQQEQIVATALHIFEQMATLYLEVTELRVRPDAANWL